MAYKRLFAILLGMVMTVEAVPAVVFAKEIDVSGNTIVAEEENAEEKEVAETTISETTVKKEKETQNTEEKAPSGSKAEEPAATEPREEAESTEKETADNAPDEAKPTDEANGEDKAQEPSETEVKATEADDKETAPSESEKTEGTDDAKPKEGAGDKETEPSVEDDKEEAEIDSKNPANSKDQEEPDLKEGEIVFEKQGEIPVDTHIFSKTPDNDEQLEAYFQKKAKEKLQGSRPVLRKAAPVTAGSRLGLYDKTAYDYFKSQITLVANGTIDSTEFTIPITNFGLGVENQSWTASQLGVSRLLYEASDGKVYIDPAAANALRKIVVIPIRLASVDDALLADCPFELYWFDKTIGVQMYSYKIAAKLIDGEVRLVITEGQTARFFVSKDYSAGDYKTDKTKIGRVNTAVSKAASVVKAAESKTDYQKLLYYCNQISSFVYYDNDAVHNSNVNYGDPWQMISVFDDDPSTNVVCEGYAKAFMYLCNLTSFEGDVSCITVTGDIPEGGHMWNVVNMDDGKNYLVDVTNIDGRGNATEKYFNALFLSGYASKSGNTYLYQYGDLKAKFTYDSESLNTYTSSQLAMNKQKYFIERPVTVNAKNGTVILSKTKAFPDDEVTFTVTPNPGYEIVSYSVNGKDITGTKFRMTGVPAEVGVTFKQSPFPVTVKCGEHGQAKAGVNEAGVDDIVALDLIPDEGYYVKSILVNGQQVYGNTFRMLLEAVTVEVEFDLITQAYVGDTLTDGINNYKVTNNAMGGDGTVAFIGSANNAANVTIPAVVTLKGIPYKVTKIASYAFNKNPYVTSVYIGANISVIESRAFVSCSKLAKISGGAKLKTISSRAIISCTKLKTFVITSSVLSKIGSYAFSGDKSLKTLSIKNTTKLSKKRVKKSLKGSKVKTVKVKKSKVKKYKKYFTKKNCGRKVKVKK